jgi:hypothetical protein
MLPSSRVIGHKEYAAGRKVDPIYAMNWRRDRVANFVPRGGVDFLMALSESEQREILDFVRHIRTARDWRVHHGKPNDDVIGHVMTLLQETTKLTPGVAGVHHHGEVYRLLLALQAVLTPQEPPAA